MLIPHENEQVRSIQLTSTRIRAGIASFLVLTILIATVSIGFLVKQNHEMRAERLQRENLLLAAEVDGIREEMENLSAQLEDLSTKDQKYRIMAGLEPIAEDVRRAGIGGPGTPDLESMAVYHLNPAVGEKVFSATYDLDALLRRARLLNSSMDEALSTLEENTERLEATPSIAPSNGYLSSLFSRNRRHPVLRVSRPHNGIDIAAAIGEPILAPAKGTVTFSGNRAGGYGLTVEIDHGFGYTTRFAHTSRLLVRTGETVERGQVIAEVGATGLVTGPHLHYEVEVDGQPVDPLNFILSDMIPD